ncbi:hypothetical protein SKAU_G00005340 [Synaphobranchus kaupii]|uniref:Uncharacterized protein n=1 Tax=Synaphobranchus kaupii TaxID=118154 RepID=A0A9Q1G903_SYNKA|nr:hypothetical protein SKAU_G00005340 [Synaphobranchus kaupii]
MYLTGTILRDKAGSRAEHKSSNLTFTPHGAEISHLHPTVPGGVVWRSVTSPSDDVSSPLLRACAAQIQRSTLVCPSHHGMYGKAEPAPPRHGDSMKVVGRVLHTPHRKPEPSATPLPPPTTASAGK